MNDLGQVAYEAYGDERNWLVFDGSPMPQWNELSGELCTAWRAAADAVVTAFVATVTGLSE